VPDALIPQHRLIPSRVGRGSPQSGQFSYCAGSAEPVQPLQRGSAEPRPATALANTIDAVFSNIFRPLVLSRRGAEFAEKEREKMPSLRPLRLCASPVFSPFFFLLFAIFAVEIPDLTDGNPRWPSITRAIRAIRGQYIFWCAFSPQCQFTTFCILVKIFPSLRFLRWHPLCGASRVLCCLLGVEVFLLAAAAVVVTVLKRVTRFIDNL
jgi:hypothetical protein